MQEGAEAAVAAIDLHVHQAAGRRAHRRAAVALDVLADDAQLRQPPKQRPRQLGPLPVVVDHGEHLIVDEASGREALRLLVGEGLAHEEVVGRERVAEVLVRHRCGGHVQHSSSGLASAWAIAR
jgi:hypothetical protein